ncbi:MAG: hypothetical protein U0X73_07855 [Thermoanaerobaculia bacterium]
MRTSFPGRLAVLSALALALAVAPAVSLAQTPAPQPMVQGAGPARQPVPEPPAPAGSELASPPADAERLAQGIAGKTLRPGKGGGRPALDDIVAFYSVGRTTSGTVIQDSFASAKPQRMLLKTTFDAWRIAMSTMTAGEIKRFWFPASVLPKNPQTGVSEAAVFDVELLMVASLPPTPKFLKTPDPTAKKTEYGASVMVLKPGNGQQKLKRADGALVDFTLWNDQGQPVLSSVAEGRPTLFPIDRVMPAFGDCLEGMTLGERRLCWVPADKNSGFPGVPTGALIFQIDLVNNLDYNKIVPKGPKPAPPATPASHP